MLRYYVYILTDPRTGKAFYVGKGQGSRMYAHEKEAMAGRVSRKCDLIRKILAAGHNIAYAVVSRFSEERDAYSAEAALIAKIGLANLTNVMPGGGTPISREFYSAARFKKLLPVFAKVVPLIVNTGGVVLRYGSECPDVTKVFLIAINGFIEKLGASFVFNSIKLYRVVAEMKRRGLAIPGGALP